MKKFILPIAFVLAVAIATVFGTGAIQTNPNDNVPTNPSQFGTLYPVAANGTQAAGYLITNSFPYAFNATPALILTTQSGNQVTNISVTATNFIVSSLNTNYSISWQAYAGYQRIEYGTTVAGVTNVTFPYPYVTAPVVQVTALNTNNASIGTITTTNFTINASVTNGVAVQWTAIGTAYNVGQNNAAYPPQTHSRK